MNEIKVQDVMTHLVVTLRPQDTIHEAARRLLSNRISGAPVVDCGRLIGVVSEADLVAAYAPPASRKSAFVTDPLMLLLAGTVLRRPNNITVADVMTTQAITISPDAQVWEAAALIDRHGVRRLPVIDPDGCVVGVIARADLVRTMARGDQQLASLVGAAGPLDPA